MSDSKMEKQAKIYNPVTDWVKSKLNLINIFDKNAANRNHIYTKVSEMRKKIDEYADKFMSDKDFAMNVENIDELINLITDYLKQIQDLNKLLSSINYSKMTAEKLKEKTERAYRLKRYKNMF